jgi:Ca2+-binding RTX toxin-like protein
VLHIQNITGSIGNDLLVGDADPNVLSGGTGRSVIIGGAGADTIVGGGGDNILIGGTTAYDTNLQALQAIMAEWTRADLSFEQRLAHLISEGNNDGRLNGSYVLNRETVFADGAQNSITGGGGLDWVFLSLDDDLFFNRKPGDHITEL